MHDNFLTTLPAGIFDDILDTLGPETGVGGDLWVDSHLKSTFAFALKRQTGLRGTTVRVRVTLSRSLPVAVRVPYSLRGSAAEDDYSDLSPDPRSGLLFLGGEMNKEIQLRLPMNNDGATNTIVLTLGELSQIGLRRSDGTGPDAPFLESETLLERSEYNAVHTITFSSPGASAGACERTPQVRDKLTQAAGVSSCSDVTVGHLAGITRLDLSGTGIIWLDEDDFRGLSNLQDLLLNDNRLRELPPEVFNGLSKLKTLWLQDNLLNELPEGIFDDPLDSLEDLRVDHRLKARLLFHLTEQNTVEGSFVRVKVWLSRALPVSVRVPYTVSGTASANVYRRLSPLPEHRLLFAAGERSNEITLTLSQNADATGKTIVFTLGTLSQIGLARSEGEGNDAPRLSAESVLDRPADSASHTVTITGPNEPAGVCERTPQVREKLMLDFGGSSCEDLTLADLSLISTLDLGNSDINSLKAHDFRGLSSMRILELRDNHLTELPKEVFRGLHNLVFLDLRGNSLSTLPDRVFRDLNSLKYLELYRNSLNTLPEQVFTGLNVLERLWLQENPLRELPEATFQGMNYLEELLLYNRLNKLPQRIFEGLSNLKRLGLSSDLTTLPKGIFNGLKKLQILHFYDRVLVALPEGVFSGLSNLESLRLGLTSLETLPEGVFSGLIHLRNLWLYSNSLRELPEGALDDALETLGGNFREGFSLELHTFRAGTLSFRGELTVSAHLKAELAFASPTQRALEDTVVRVPVTLSRKLPVAVRVPYSVGFGGSSAGYTNLSPAPDSGLLFRAGETQREISLTLTQDAAAQGERSLVLTLGKPTEIRLRRSEGQPPDAPYLRSESLVLRSEDRAVHTVTVSGVDPPEQAPFCLSLWQGSPCSTVAILPHFFMGPMGEHTATTEVAVTHRDPEAAECEAALLFHRGNSPAPAVSFGGRFPDGNLVRTTLPRGGAELVTLTAPDAGQLTSGALYVFARSPCQADSLQVQARHLLEGPSDGDTVELFSIAGQSESDWLGDGDCRRLTALFGNGRDVGLSWVTARPEQSAPPGTRLRFAEFDLKGNFIGSLDSLEISGQHQAISPWSLNRPATIQMCLDVPGASDFQLAIDAMGTTAGGSKVQFSTVSIPDDAGPDGGGPNP
ncbi:MAG: leucine-rich repeat protein [Acidobacteria bacterium]|nr:leucine-rich repeat protein [Acidobacteriota bacterium]